jgi:hypothetical protein
VEGIKVYQSKSGGWYMRWPGKSESAEPGAAGAATVAAPASKAAYEHILRCLVREYKDKVRRPKGYRISVFPAENPVGAHLADAEVLFDGGAVVRGFTVRRQDEIGAAKVMFPPTRKGEGEASQQSGFRPIGSLRKGYTAVLTADILTAYNDRVRSLAPLLGEDWMGRLVPAPEVAVTPHNVEDTADISGSAEIGARTRPTMLSGKTPAEPQRARGILPGLVCDGAVNPRASYEGARTANRYKSEEEEGESGM